MEASDEFAKLHAEAEALKMTKHVKYTPVLERTTLYLQIQYHFKNRKYVLGLPGAMALPSTLVLLDETFRE